MAVGQVEVARDPSAQPITWQARRYNPRARQPDIILAERGNCRDNKPCGLVFPWGTPALCP